MNSIKKHFRVLVMGMPGSGKSHIAQAMKVRGYNAIDVDTDEPYLAKIIDDKGEQVAYDPDGGEEWWKTHFYVYRVELLKETLRNSTELYLFGNVGGEPGKDNDNFGVARLFDKVCYLDAPSDMLITRLKSRDNNPFGKNSWEQEKMPEWKAEMEITVHRRGFEVIDATQPLDEIIRQIVSNGDS